MLLEKEDDELALGDGLMYWILYNKLAIQNSAADHICRIVTTNHAMIANPLDELDRIVDELIKCGLPRPPMKLNQDTLNSFLDRHNGTIVNEMPFERLSVSQGGSSSSGCKVYEYDFSENPVEASLYSKATKIYCDLESGEAYKKNYVWPIITDEERRLYLRFDDNRVAWEQELRYKYHGCAWNVSSAND